MQEMGQIDIKRHNDRLIQTESIIKLNVNY